MRAAEIVRLVREERGVDAAEYDLGPALTRGAPDLVAPQRVPRVDADADDVARLHLLRVERLERLVADDGVPEARRRRGREHEQPARRDDGGAERDVAWVHEKHAHSGISRLMVDGGGDAWARARSELPRDRLARAGERAADRNAAAVLHRTRLPMRRPLAPASDGRSARLPRFPRGWRGHGETVHRSSRGGRKKPRIHAVEQPAALDWRGGDAPASTVVGSGVACRIGGSLARARAAGRRCRCP